jgi:hypothetical protein
VRTRRWTGLPFPSVSFGQVPGKHLTSLAPNSRQSNRGPCGFRRFPAAPRRVGHPRQVAGIPHSSAKTAYLSQNARLAPGWRLSGRSVSRPCAPTLVFGSLEPKRHCVRQCSRQSVSGCEAQHLACQSPPRVPSIEPVLPAVSRPLPFGSVEPNRLPSRHAAGSPGEPPRIRFERVSPPRSRKSSLTEGHSARPAASAPVSWPARCTPPLTASTSSLSKSATCSLCWRSRYSITSRRALTARAPLNPAPRVYARGDGPGLRAHPH